MVTQQLRWTPDRTIAGQIFDGTGNIQFTLQIIWYRSGLATSSNVQFGNEVTGNLTLVVQQPFKFYKYYSRDNLLELNSGAASSNDTGIIMERGSTGDNVIIAWDESVDKFVMGTTTTL